ncbi:MAG: hypothetical protein LBT94_03545 [Prevotellaceae bacterium]|jgi:hypothetical protein|nr:hypothetical protein [Prevotellaceae bacterium]
MLITPHTKAKPYSVGYAPAIDAPSIDTADDTLMSKEEFFAKIAASEEEARLGKVLAMLPEETLDDFLLRVEECIA